jgi:DNA modification methylase
MGQLTERVTAGIVAALRRIADLRPHPRNYRRHGEHQLAVLRESLRVHGQQKPVVITPDGVILAGHGLVQAAELEGWTEIACHVYDGPYPEAFLAIDNRASDLAEDDTAALTALLADLRKQEQLGAAGYDSETLDRMLAELQAQQPKKDEDWTPEGAPESEPTRTQLGDIWALGQHRLLVGDCTIGENWERLMAGKQAHAITTDPPYGVNYAGGHREMMVRPANQNPDAYWDQLTPEGYEELIRESLRLAYQHSDEESPLYIWFGTSRMRQLLAAVADAGWEERTLLVWVKNAPAGALFSQYIPWHEPLYYCFKRGKTPRWHGPTNERTVWEHEKAHINDLHPTMKPLLLIERTIVNATEPGMLVVDPFMGSGTAIIAAWRTARVAYGFELDPRYCDNILARWEKFTGEEAVKVDG